MIGRKSKQQPAAEEEVPRGFDDFELRLGDVMRGERATLGKSLLDVQREIRIKANYIAAIENCDPSAFDTPGFIAGYVRSYARYLSMDPDETFAVFCAESGFSTAHGMSEKASGVKAGKSLPIAGPQTGGADPFKQPALPFTPAGDSFLSRVEPGAVGSALVLVALIAGIGYGGWTVLQEVQRVRLTPVDQTPVVLSDLDPVESALATVDDDAAPEAAAPADRAAAGVFTPPSNEALDRLYRPQALDVPVLVARDAPISTLDPSRLGVFASQDTRSLPDMPATGGVPQRTAAGEDGIQNALAEALGGVPTEGAATPQVLQPAGAGVTMIAVRPAWVRVRAADGSVIYETIMNAGDTFDVPQTDEPATLRVGESGAIYFAMEGATYGPVGPAGSVTSNLALAADSLSETYQVAELSSDTDLARVVAELDLPAAPALPGAAPATE